MKEKDIRKFTWFVAIIFVLRVLSSDFSDIKSVFFGFFEGFGAIFDFMILILLVIQILDNRKEIIINEETYNNSKIATLRADTKRVSNKMHVEVFNIGLSSAFDIEIRGFVVDKDNIESPIVSLSLEDNSVNFLHINKSLLKSEDKIDFIINIGYFEIAKYRLKIKYSDRENKNKEEVIDLD